jgi:hypothetical protein
MYSAGLNVPAAYAQEDGSLSVRSCRRSNASERHRLTAIEARWSTARSGCTTCTIEISHGAMVCRSATAAGLWEAITDVRAECGARPVHSGQYRQSRFLLGDLIASFAPTSTLAASLAARGPSTVNKAPGSENLTSVARCSRPFLNLTISFAKEWSGRSLHPPLRTPQQSLERQSLQ